MKKLLLIDDHPVVQIGMKALLERNRLFKQIDLASCGAEAIQHTQEEYNYDLIIADVNLPDYEIISLVKIIRTQAADCPILIFSVEPPMLHIKRLIDLGVSGFLDKTSPDEELLFAISNILAGRAYFSSEILLDALGDGAQYAKFKRLQTLSDRESEILSLMVKGKSSHEISEILDLHKSSVATYRSRVFRKLGVRSNFELYKWALKEGLIVI